MKTFLGSLGDKNVMQWWRINNDCINASDWYPLHIPSPLPNPGTFGFDQKVGVSCS